MREEGIGLGGADSFLQSRGIDDGGVVTGLGDKQGLALAKRETENYDAYLADIEDTVEQCFVHPDFFTAGESSTLFGVEESVLWDRFERDGRFLRISASATGEEYLISKEKGFDLLVETNIRLARSGIFEINRKDLTYLLRLDCSIDYDFGKLLDFGIDFKLISRTHQPDYFFFPLVFFISESRAIDRNSLIGALERLTYRRAQLGRKQDRLKRLIMRSLRNLPDRKKDIIISAYGLFSTKPQTLSNIGARHNLTRERVRQIRVTSQIKMRKKQSGHYLLQAIYELSLKQPSTSIFYKGSDDYLNEIKFILDYCMVPYCEPSGWDCLVIGYGLEQMLAGIKEIRDMILKSTESWYKKPLFEEYIELVFGTYDKHDVSTLSVFIRDYIVKRFQLCDKLYLALRHIGHAAHYSVISKKVNELFPNQDMSEAYALTILSRRKQLPVDHGITWVGIRGTYSLAEFGDTQPEPLQKMAYDIVMNEFKQNERPVHISHITRELAKLRPNNPKNSLKMAVSLNPLLKRASKKGYVPVKD